MRLLKLMFCTFFIIYFQEVSSQKKSNLVNRFSIEFGVNWIDSSGEQNPLRFFKDYSNLAFSSPFKLELDYLLNNSFELYLSHSINKFSKNQLIDSYILQESYSYSSTDLGLKYYINKFNLFDINFSVFVHGGLGMFDVTKSGLSSNFGIGGVISITNTLYFVVSSVAKFAVNHEFINSNHFQYSVGIRIKLSNTESCYCPY